MIEKIGSEEAYVKDYTSNFDVKEFIQSVLIPKAFPNIPVNKLNLGYVGLTSEYIGEAIEDAYGTASLMVNESFITRAVLPESIYSAASLYNLGYSFAIPSSCKFGVQLSLDDVIKYATKVPNTGKYRYILDRDTRVIVGGSSYRFDYDVFIEYQIIDGKRVFNVYYDTSQPCSISNLDSKFIQHMVTANGWLMMIVRLKEFDRKITTHSITDNRMTTNSDIELRWTNQIAGMDLTYITPKGDRREMKVKHEYTGLFSILFSEISIAVFISSGSILIFSPFLSLSTILFKYSDVVLLYSFVDVPFSTYSTVLNFTSFSINVFISFNLFSVITY